MRLPCSPFPSPRVGTGRRTYSSRSGRNRPTHVPRRPAGRPCCLAAPRDLSLFPMPATRGGAREMLAPTLPPANRIPRRPISKTSGEGRAYHAARVPKELGVHGFVGRRTGEAKKIFDAKRGEAGMDSIAGNCFGCWGLRRQQGRTGTCYVHARCPNRLVFFFGPAFLVLDDRFWVHGRR
ncbi:hypothetical protein BDY21DRAFT_190345 [Lineolata rhizophorae]|uniref:Uncharacterized protein n=1 Tax=Lineolata rhizophorae TaxID=578093 RepID=A0A6A6P6Q7_9PEZI|nr:hypothetical protein BDY21DRAFT_190345 [Lineolata rhizophorae]